GDVHDLSVRERELRGERAGEAEAERRHIAPAEIAAGDLRLEHRARLIARVAGVRGDERVLRVEHLHHLAVHTIGIDRRLVRLYQRTELREERLLRAADLVE